MNEETIKVAATLLAQRKTFEDALSLPMIKELSTETDWDICSKTEPERKKMCVALHECRQVCEMILRNRAQSCINDINRQLKQLGIDS